MLRKKKKPLFGADIEPNCHYCRQNGASGEKEPLCVLGLQMKNGKCKKYRYDPLRREPRTAPPLRSEGFREEDFKL